MHDTITANLKRNRRARTRSVDLIAELIVRSAVDDDEHDASSDEHHARDPRGEPPPEAAGRPPKPHWRAGAARRSLTARSFAGTARCENSRAPTASDRPEMRPHAPPIAYPPGDPRSQHARNPSELGNGERAARRVSPEQVDLHRRAAVHAADRCFWTAARGEARSTGHECGQRGRSVRQEQKASSRDDRQHRNLTV